MALKNLIVGSVLILEGVAFGVGGLVTFAQGYKHPEYHINAQLPSSAHVRYYEQNPWNIFDRSYAGYLEIKHKDGTVVVWRDYDNDLKLSNGDRVELNSSTSSINFTVDPANPNIEKIVGQLLPQIDSVLEQALEHNTAPLRR